MKKIIFIGLVLILVMSGCADVSHVEECLKPEEHTYGFWGGTWHGLISGFSFVGSLFSDDIAVYAVNNNGAWYDFGFLGGFFPLFKCVTSLLGLRGGKR